VLKFCASSFANPDFVLNAAKGEFDIPWLVDQEIKNGDQKNGWQNGVVGITPYMSILSLNAALRDFIKEMTDRLTVLLAEDDPNDVLLTQIAFEKARLANPLQVVRDGEEAIAYLKGARPFADRARFPLPILMLLDLKMPKLNGFQVLQWLRRQPGVLGRLPVAIMTSSDHDPDAARAFQLGADSYLQKPPDAEALLALVKRLHAYWLILDDHTELQSL
jgi:CheY-like chemotaxis protein